MNNTTKVRIVYKNKFIGYYISRIHTKKDVMMDEKNIDILKEGTVKLIARF